LRNHKLVLFPCDSTALLSLYLMLTYWGLERAESRRKYNFSLDRFVAFVQKCRKRTAAKAGVTSDMLVTSSREIKPEAVNVAFRSAAIMDWTDSSSTGSSDDVTEPEVKWDTIASSSPDAEYPVGGSPPEQKVAACWTSGFMTHPSPDPLPWTKSTPGYREPFCPRAGWGPSAGVPEETSHDQWLRASHSTPNEDSSCRYQIYSNYNTEKLNESNFSPQRQLYFGSFPVHSPAVAKYEPIEDTSGICGPFDNDYIDDLLTVMAREANYFPIGYSDTYYSW